MIFVKRCWPIGLVALLVSSWLTAFFCSFVTVLHLVSIYVWRRSKGSPLMFRSFPVCLHYFVWTRDYLLLDQESDVVVVFWAFFCLLAA